MQYTPLDPSKKEIRLIELLPRPTNASVTRRPRCNITHVSLDDKPDYAALSYTWGDPQDTELITVGHNSVPVTRNLYSALEHLRYDKTVRTIWIDALCINQSDNKEKSLQVELMREIYRRATFVSIWLGPADTTSDKVMDFLHQFGTKAMEFSLDGGPLLIRQVSAQWRKLASHPLSVRDRSSQKVTVESTNSTKAPKSFLMRDLNEFYYSISGSHEQDHLLPVEGIGNLFRRVWWSRIWVLQELSLAQKAGFVCGTKRISRRRCTAALNAFIALKLVHQEMTLSDAATSTTYQRSIAMADFDWRPNLLLSMWDTQRFTPYPLLALLRATCVTGMGKRFLNAAGLEATDPRDKIYGILGLAADRDELKEFGFQLDYAQSCQDVYIYVTATILKQGHLSVLSLSQFPKTQIGLPSWVPDWSMAQETSLQGTGIDHMTLEPEYKASGALLPTKPTFSGVGAKMSVSLSGFIYDEVHDIGNTWAELYPFEDPIQSQPLVPAKRLLEELVRLSLLQGKLYKNLKERICGAARTVTAEIGYNENDRWARIGNQRYHTAASLLMIGVNDSSEKSLLDSEFLQLIKSDGIQLQINKHNAAKYCGEIEAKARGRKPLVTAKGHLGLGPDHVRPGDAIALLSGCQAPFVLRKCVGGKYEIVGEAYVDGIMDGEAVVRRDNVGLLVLI